MKMKGTNIFIIISMCFLFGLGGYYLHAAKLRHNIETGSELNGGWFMNQDHSVRLQIDTKGGKVILYDGENGETSYSIDSISRWTGEIVLSDEDNEEYDVSFHIPAPTVVFEYNGQQYMFTFCG